jgi:hypothetical protein
MAMSEPQARDPKRIDATSSEVEQRLEQVFDRLPVDSRVMVVLFAALNSASTLANEPALSDRLWQKMHTQLCGPLVGQSEEVNWLKGICDGIFLVVDHS